MWPWKRDEAPGDAPTEWAGEPPEEDTVTWADGGAGPTNPVSRVYGPNLDDRVHEARLASAE